MQHVFKNKSVRFGGSIPGKVVIGKGTWIAAHVSIKCGVEVESGNIIGANSFVANNTENDAIYGGIPAKFIKNNQDSSFSFADRGELLDRSN